MIESKAVLASRAETQGSGWPGGGHGGIFWDDGHVLYLD